MNSFLYRLQAGRSDALCEFITKVRDAFEAHAEKGEQYPVARLTELLRMSGVPATLFEATLNQVTDRLKRQSREFVSLPELFEYFGFIFQDLTDKSISIAEAFAMFRLKSNSVEVRAAAEYALEFIDKVLNNPKDSRFWEISLSNEVNFFFSIIKFKIIMLKLFSIFIAIYKQNMVFRSWKSFDESHRI